jgi:exosome complex protein LRP1
MDPQIDLPDLVEDLEVDIDELTTALEPLLSKPLSTTASSLPLLDKAKLYCLAAYAIESLLFASLTASGVNATEHPIFKEIARLRQYNTKIKEIEDRGIKGSAEGRARLDVAAAGRFIKHGLAGNDKYDLERQERMAKERARAHLKAQQINKKFDDEGSEVQGKSQNMTPQKRGPEEEEDDDDEVMQGLEDEPAVKKARVQAEHEGAEADTPQPRKRGRPSKKDRKAEETQSSTTSSSTRVTRKRNTRGATQSTEEEEEGEEGQDEDEEQSDQAPKTRSETFTALLDGSLSEKHKQKKAKGKGSKKGSKAKAK